MILSYDLARGLHLIAVIAFMAGMLMLPRLYAYQTESEPGGELERKMIEAARRLRTFILSPALVLVWVFGLYLLFAFHGGLAGLMQPWLATKIALAVALSGLHGYLVSAGKKLARGERKHSGKYWRMLNEIPFVIAIAIVLLATLQPG
jgi:protoporphyrinogen IX oxidase